MAHVDEPALCPGRPEAGRFGRWTRGLLPLLTIALAALLLPTAPAAAHEEIIRETRILSPFHSVRFDGSGEVDVTVGREFSLVVETTNRAMPTIRTEVVGEELQIRRKRSGRHAPLRIEITMPVMTALELNGSAVAQVHGPIHSPRFAVRIAGSGSASIEGLNVDDFDVSLSGSGEIDASGTASQVDLKTAGTAKMQLAKLEAESATVSISGSGRADLRVASSLDGHIRGSGEIHLTGSPAEMNVRTQGSGRIIQTADDSPAPAEVSAEAAGTRGAEASE